MKKGQSPVPDFWWQFKVIGIAEEKKSDFEIIFEKHSNFVYLYTFLFGALW